MHLLIYPHAHAEFSMTKKPFSTTRWRHHPGFFGLELETKMMKSSLMMILKSSAGRMSSQVRYFSSGPNNIKRFYKSVSIIRSETDRYEIILDKRRLKTPKGNIFYIQNEPLASMIAAEWDSQKEKIHLDRMHLTTLANTVIDNPSGLNSEDISEKLISYLEFDTCCYRNSIPEELFQLQNEKLDPIIQWFADRFNCSIPVTNGVVLPEIDPKTKEILRKYLRSFNEWCLIGIQYSTENLKSLILSTALINQHLNVRDAVELSRIEENFQSGRWNRVEYHHDLEQMNLETRISAAILFVLLNLENSVISQKLKN